MIFKHQTSLQRYETSTRMVFHAIFVKYGKSRNIVLLLVPSFLSVPFFNHFQTICRIFPRSVFVGFWRKMASRQPSRFMTASLIFQRWWFSSKCWPNILSNRFLIPGRVDCSGTKPPTSTPPVLGTLGLLVQVPASRSHPRVLRRKDRDLLRLARFLHGVAPTCSSCWLRRLSLRSLLFEKSLSALHCKLFIAVWLGLKLFYVILSRNGHFGRERDSSGGVPRTSQKVR